MKILTMAQGSGEWAKARCGVLTASEADNILTPLFKVRSGEGVESYMFRKLSERLLGYAEDSGSTFNMDMGQMAERIALPWFNFEFNENARQVGFCLSDDGNIGCSPDALGEGFGVEIKFPTAPIHLKYMVKNELPTQYAAQCHFSMAVTGFDEWRFVSFSRVFTPLVVVVNRDEKIQQAIRGAVDAFYEKFNPIYNRIKSAKDAENQQKQAEYDANPNKDR